MDKKKKRMYMLIMILICTFFVQNCFAEILGTMILTNNKMGLLRLSNGAFDLRGMDADGDMTVQTTFKNEGYTTRLNVKNLDPSNGRILEFDDKNTAVYGGIGVTFLPENYGGTFFKLVFAVTNTNPTERTISLSYDADIQIDKNDKAPVKKLENGKGFEMRDNDYKFTVLCQNTKGISNADSYWFGFYKSREAYLYTQVEEDSIENIDSGFTVSYQNRVLQPGETQYFSSLIGIGVAADVKMETEYPYIGDNTKLPVNISSEGTVIDSMKVVNVDTGKVYYKGMVKDSLQLATDIDTEGEITILCKLLDVYGDEVAESEEIVIQKMNLLNRMAAEAAVKTGKDHFLVVEDEQRLIEDNTENRALVQAIKENATGVYLVSKSISPVLQPLLER